jgi:hypothetical protein
MFEGAVAFDTDVSAWDVGAVTSFTSMFHNTALGACRKHNIQASFSANTNWAAAGYAWTDVCPPITDDNKHIAGVQWVTDEAASKATHGHISTWNVSQVTSLHSTPPNLTGSAAYGVFSSLYSPSHDNFNADLNAWVADEIRTCCCIPADLWLC